MATISHYLKNETTKSRELLSLLAFICQKDLSWILAHPEYELNKKEAKELTNKHKRLNQGWPLAYLIGYKDFFNYHFQVSPAVLIPRPESEMIIEYGLNLANEKKQPDYFLDLGTGSGALIISLAAEFKKMFPKIYSSARFRGGDISVPALKVAKLNARSYQLSRKITFRHGNLLAPFARELSKLSTKHVFISANLPYLTPLERIKEKSIIFEPTLALVGGKDGLELYRQLLTELPKILQKKTFSLIMEINPKQAPALSAFAHRQFPSANVKKISDLNSQIRFISLQSQ